MEQYIQKSALVAEIEELEKALKNACKPNPFGNMEECMTDAELQALDVVKEIINTLEVKEVDTWHLQEKENIYDAVKGWSLQTFVCVMKDGTIQEFTGNLDEDYEGHINVHIYGVNDDYDNVDDIVKWIEFT